MQATNQPNNVKSEAVKASLEEAHRSILEWSDQRRNEAAATVNSRPLVSYYVSEYPAKSSEE